METELKDALPCLLNTPIWDAIQTVKRGMKIAKFTKHQRAWAFIGARLMLKALFRVGMIVESGKHMDRYAELLDE